MVKYHVTAVGQCVLIVQGPPVTGEIAITLHTDAGEKTHLQMSEQMAALLKENWINLCFRPAAYSPSRTSNEEDGAHIDAVASFLLRRGGSPYLEQERSLTRCY